MAIWAEKELRYLYSKDFEESVKKLPPTLREYYIKTVSERPLKLKLGEKLEINGFKINEKQRDSLLKKFEKLVKENPAIIYGIIEDYEKSKRRYLANPNFSNLVNLCAYELRWYYPYGLLEELLTYAYGPEHYSQLSILMTPTSSVYLSINNEKLSNRRITEVKRKREETKKEILKSCKEKFGFLYTSALLDGIIFVVEQNEELSIFRREFFEKNRQPTNHK